MASNKPVPSRAAINALRGLAFTTSCTVILLAEERRRRLNIARSAVENAKKLHTASSRRRPAALAEQLSWDDRYSELDDDVRMTLPLTIGRRKRKRVKPSDDNFEVSPRSQGRANGVSMLLHNVSLPSAKEGGKTEGGTDQNLIQEALAALSLDLSTKGRTFPITHREVSQEIAGPIPHQQHVSGNPEENTVVAVLNELAKQKSDAPLTDNAVEGSGKGLHEAFQSAQKFLREPSSADGSATHGALVIRSLLGVLEQDDLTTPATEKSLYLLFSVLQSEVYESTTIHGVLSNKECLRILRSVVRYTPEKVAAVYPPILRCCEDTITLNADFFGWLQSGEVTHQVIAKIVTSLNDLTSRKTHPGEYSAHLESARVSATCGSWDAAKKEVRFMMEVDREKASEDVDLILLGILEGTTKGSCSPSAQDFFALVCDIYVENHQPAEYETILRQLVEKRGMKICQRWINSVIDWHWSREDSEAAFSWLQFSFANHLWLNSQSLHRTFSHCEKYWGASASQKGMAWVYRRLRAAGIKMPRYAGMKSSQTSKGVAPVRPLRISSLGNDPNNESGKSVIETSTFITLKRLAKVADWTGVIRSYGEYHSRGGLFSARCLKLAVIAHLKTEKHGYERAAELIDEALENGHDVEDASTPLLIQRIQKSWNPARQITYALNRGLPVSGKVFNAAFLSHGKRGELRKGIRICHMAAEHDGKGELLFSDYNFSNLLYAHVALGPSFYGDAHQLLSQFMEREKFWHGNKVCKEAVKHAMKVFAARSVSDPELSHAHEELAFKADEVLQHIGRCRAKFSPQQSMQMSGQAEKGEDDEVIRGNPGSAETQYGAGGEPRTLVYDQTDGLMSMRLEAKPAIAVSG